jgi:hypothetical protein
VAASASAARSGPTRCISAIFHPTSGTPNAWVDQRVQEVHDQVDQDKHGRQH